MKLVLSVGLKGGVGKTTVAVGVALALSRAGKKVGLLDLDYRTPNVLEALNGGTPILTQTFMGDILIPPEIRGIKVFSMSFIWPEGKSVMVRDEDAMQDVLNLLTPGVLAWGDMDYLVVDTPPTSTGVVQVALDAVGVAGAMMVTHASTFARADTLRTIDLFREKGVPVLGMVCNQVGLHDLGEHDMQAVAVRFGLPFFVAVPHCSQPAALLPFFDQIAHLVETVTPVQLQPEEIRSEAWTKLLSLTQTLSESPRPGS